MVIEEVRRLGCHDAVAMFWRAQAQLHGYRSKLLSLCISRATFQHNNMSLGLPPAGHRISVAPAVYALFMLYVLPNRMWAAAFSDCSDSCTSSLFERVVWEPVLSLWTCYSWHGLCIGKGSCCFFLPTSQLITTQPSRQIKMLCSHMQYTSSYFLQPSYHRPVSELAVCSASVSAGYIVM